MRKITYTPTRNRIGIAKPEILASDEWFSKILLRMGDAVIATDNKGAVLSMNKVAEELTGWTVADSKGRHIEDIFDAINDKTLLPIENPVTIAMKEDREILLANHTVLIKKDKTQRIIVDSALPIHNTDSKIIGGALIFRDVTEETVNKKKLIESEELLKGIMDTTTLVIYTKDLDGNYLFINRQKEEVYNIKADDLIGRKNTHHLNEVSSSESARTDSLAIEQKKLVEYEQVIQHANGDLHTYHTSKFPLYDSNQKIYAVCSISKDISESKKNVEMQRQLAIQEIIIKSKIQYDELTKNMPNMFFSLDRSFRLTSFNKASEKFMGREAHQVIGKTMEEIFPIGETLYMSEIKEVLETEMAKSFHSTFSIDENTFTYVINIYPTENGVSVLMTDLTRQKKSETEMLDLVVRLQKKNKDLRQFAYTVSHDLRAPIARVLGLVALTGVGPDDKINNLTILENVTSELRSLDEVVKDMNTVISAREEGREKAYMGFENELNLIKKVLEAEIVESKVKITADFIEAEGIVSVKSYLYSIMYNLLSNAIKYRRRQVPLTVHFSAVPEKEFVCLSVTDNGMGIDLKRNGDKIFGLYNRFHGNIIDGKGIGLNLVRSQAESLGGSVEVESEVNKGTTFKVYFPVEKDNKTATNLGTFT